MNDTTVRPETSKPTRASLDSHTPSPTYPEPTISLPEDSRVELSNLCEQRAGTYALLSRLYGLEADEALLADLRTASFPAKTGDKDVDEGYYRIATYLSATSESTLLDLAVDYTRTFIGHGNNAYSAAYPFESVYTSEKRLMMQEARDEIIHAYRAVGMEVSPAWKDPEDHIALELQYMQILCRRTTEALQTHDDDAALALFDLQRSFMRNHLRAWVPMMTADVKRFSRTDFYQGLASLTEGFLRVDHAFLKTVID